MRKRVKLKFVLLSVVLIFAAILAYRLKQRNVYDNSDVVAAMQLHDSILQTRVQLFTLLSLDPSSETYDFSANSVISYLETSSKKDIELLGNIQTNDDAVAEILEKHKVHSGKNKDFVNKMTLERTANKNEAGNLLVEKTNIIVLYREYLSSRGVQVPTIYHQQ